MNPGFSPAPAGPANVHAAPALTVSLRAGPLRLVFDRGELRWIRLGEREVLRGIYAAVRESGWATVPASIEDLEIQAEPESFRISFVARHRRGSVQMDWKSQIEGHADGRVEYAIDGVAGGSFLRNRIGLCVLHPLAECAGRACVVETVDGQRRPGVFPQLVSPHQPFLDVRAIAHEVLPGVEAELRLTGDTFETEDQRNWSDASFKTYCTPLALPFPVEVTKGTRVRQSVSLRLAGLTSEPARAAVAAVPGAAPRKRNGAQPVVVLVEPAGLLARPALGLGGAGLATLDSSDVAALSGLRPDHLRAELRLAAPGWEEALERASANARLLDTALELAVLLPEEPRAPLAALAARVRPLQPRVSHWIVLRAADLVTRDGDVALAREALAPVSPGARFAGGTDRHFAELNRRRPEPAGLDRLSFALTPQVHAFDEATMVENLGSLAWTAQTARGFAGQATLGISPVTLRPRVDPRPLSSRDPDEPPFTNDPRQALPFAAAWTLGFVAAAAAAGYASLTFYELVGPRGVVADGRAFPVGHALAEVAELKDAAVATVRSRRPERVQALALQAAGRTRVFLANVTGEAHPVRVEGLQGVVRAAALGEAGPAAETGFELELAPYAVVRLDVTG